MSSDNGPRFVFAQNNWTRVSIELYSKYTGQYHSMKGTAVEAVGNATGWENWQRDGKQEHATGEAEYNAARAKGYAEGTSDRLMGKKDTVVGSITGDRSQEASGGYSTLRIYVSMLIFLKAMCVTTKAKLNRSSTSKHKLQLCHKFSCSTNPCIILSA